MGDEEKKEALPQKPEEEKIVAQKEEKKHEVGSLPGGDYMIHVFIENSRQFKTKGKDDTINPIIECRCIGQKVYTKGKADIGPTASIAWNEHCFFDLKQVPKDKMEGAKIEIRVLDKSFFKDTLIGKFSA